MSHEVGNGTEMPATALPANTKLLPDAALVAGIVDIYLQPEYTQAAVLRHNFRICPDEALEIVHEAVFRAYARRETFHADSKRAIGPWVTRIALNLATDRSRRGDYQPVSLEARAAELGEDIDMGRATPISGNACNSSDGNSESENAAKKVTQLLLSKLSERSRDIMVMRLQHLSNGEIAARLEMTEGAVKAAAFRALKMLREIADEALSGQAGTTYDAASLLRQLRL